MLGDDAVNKTVPLILCAEENVEGTHGATIGELDADTLFYFESRGIDQTAARSTSWRARRSNGIDRATADDEAFADRLTDGGARRRRSAGTSEEEA